MAAQLRPQCRWALRKTKTRQEENQEAALQPVTVLSLPAWPFDDWRGALTQYVICQRTSDPCIHTNRECHHMLQQELSVHVWVYTAMSLQRAVISYKAGGI